MSTRTDSTSDWRLVGTVAAILVGVMLLPLPLYYAVRSHLPDRIPEGFSWGPDPDASVLASNFPLRYLASTVVFLAIGLVVIVVLRKRQDAKSILIMCSLVLVLGMPAAMAVRSLVVSLGAPSLLETRGNIWNSLATSILLAPVCVVLTTWVRRRRVEEDNQPAMPLGTTERIVWTGRVRSTALAWPALVAVPCALAVWFVSPFSAVVLLLLAAFALYNRAADVVIDHRGLQLVRGRLRLMRTVVPLRSISSARVMHIRGNRWSGWTEDGKSPGLVDVRSIVNGAGPALAVVRHDQPVLVLSSGRAREAAEVVNALVARAKVERADRVIEPRH